MFYEFKMFFSPQVERINLMLTQLAEAKAAFEADRAEAQAAYEAKIEEMRLQYEQVRVNLTLYILDLTYQQAQVNLLDLSIPIQGLNYEQVQFNLT